MKHPRLTALAAVLMAGLAAPGAAFAGSENVEIDRLRSEFEQKLKALQENYEGRLQEMEARLSRNEGQAKAALAAPAADVGSQQPAVQGGNAQTAFNPEISLVLQGAFVKQKDVADRSITGFLPATPDRGNSRGFSLGNTELVIAANIDPYFRGHANLSVGDGTVDVEEAWFQSIGLGNGLSFKGGRFISGIGYGNEQHPHVWDFADQSLMYRVLFGEHLVQDGVQMKWLAPSETYLEFGLEAGRGQFFPGSEAGGNRSGAGTWAAFAKVGDDIDVSQSWRAGINYLATHPRAREGLIEDRTGVQAHTGFSGESKTWIADFVWKWAPEGNAMERSLKLQGEAFRRSESGDMSCSDNSAAGGACSGLADGYRATQSGWYAQGVYQFMPRWRVGYRYDRLDPGNISYGALPLAASDYRPVKNSLMADYSPSEFSRFRLQLAQDKSMQGVVDNQMTLQYIHSLGAHGAHNF